MAGRVMKWMYVVLLCHTCIGTAEPPLCQVCPNGWVYFSDSCYLFAEDIKMDWTEATHYCTVHHHSDLVSIETSAENAFVKTWCQRLAKNGTGLFWTAATDSDIEGFWEWYPSNDPLDFTDWAPGEPNTWHHVNEDCVHLNGGLGYAWNDYDCTLANGSPLCELRLTNSHVPIIG